MKISNPVVKIYLSGQTKLSVVFQNFGWSHWCGSHTSSMTIDHIIPKDKGGKDSWTNLVTACKKCNIYKGNYSLRERNMKLFKKPVQPSYVFHLQKYKYKHPTWNQYIYL